MKNVFSLISLLIAVTTACAQPVYSAKEGKASFFSKAPMEDITAETKSVNTFINTTNGEVVFVIPITSFKFEKALMQEHFNEKYMESEKYPTATYKGKINEQLDFTMDGEYTVTSTGKLTMHGEERERTDTAKITVKEGKAMLDCTFKVKLADHKIEIPKLVIENIAEIVDVTIHAVYTPHKAAEKK